MILRRKWSRNLSPLTNYSHRERIIDVILAGLVKKVRDYQKQISTFDNFLKQFNIEDKEEIHENKSKYNLVSDNQADVIKIYNYWDIKLYNEILNKKIPLE